MVDLEIATGVLFAMSGIVRVVIRFTLAAIAEGPIVSIAGHVGDASIFFGKDYPHSLTMCLLYANVVATWT